MGIYTIVGKSTDTLGPGQIYAGDIKVADGDVFFIDPSAEGLVNFISAYRVPVNFEILVEQSNPNKLQLNFGSNQSPWVNIANNANLANTYIDATATNSINLNLGDNVTFGGYSGSQAGVDNINIGNGFTATGEWRTGGGDDNFRIGDGASIKYLNTGAGDDSIVVGTNATIGGIDGDLGTDTLVTKTKGLSTKNIEKIAVVCYAAGTLIDTPDGPQDVAKLQPGDSVSTLDNAAQKILWVHHDQQPLDMVEKDARPIIIRAGALGSGIPSRNLIVSPQHRILVGGGGQLQDKFKSEALVPAKSLLSLRGIRHVMGRREITWIHFACKRHEVVVANGCLSESLLLGPMVVNGLTAGECQALRDIYGTPATPDAALNGPPARQCLAVGVVRRQLASNDIEKSRQRAKEIRTWDLDLAAETRETEYRQQVKPASDGHLDRSDAA